MKNQTTKRSSFSGKIGFVLSAAGASVGLGNIWRFPYLAAKYGGGIFLLIYIILALTFGYTMIMAETSLGRMTKKSPVGAFASFGNSRWSSLGGWINAIIPVLIVPYYSVIGGWVLKYLVEYVRGHAQPVAEDGYFSAFISDGFSTEICFVIFSVITLAIIYAGVRNGIERVSKFMMPILVVLSVIIAIYSVTRPGALAGVKYFLVPNISNFSWMTVVAAMGQMFYSLSIAMGILITFGSYMNDYSGGVCVLWRRSGHLTGWTGIDVYYNPKSFCKYGIWNFCGSNVLLACTFCGTYQFNRTDGKCGIHV